MWRRRGSLRKTLIAILFCVCAVEIIRKYRSAEDTTLQPPHLRELAACQAKLWSYFWSRTVAERIKIPAGFDCIPDPLVTKETLTISEVLDSGKFDGLSGCRERVPDYSDKPLPNIALASFPGSGNTWTRHLIEQLSEIYTVSMYCSGGAGEVFKAECSRSKWPFTIAIKTHEISNMNSYDGAVLIIRSPYKAIFAEYNRAGKGKMGSVGAEAFAESSWKDAVSELAVEWRRHTGTWLSDFEGPMHILAYERLVTDFYEEVYKLASFLNVTVTYGDLWCLNRNKEGSYHRKKVVEPVFTDEQKTFVDNLIREIKEQLQSKFQLTLPY